MRTVSSAHSIASRVSERGITLLEVLISFSLVSIGMMGILTTFTTSHNVQKDTDDRAKALFIAQQVLEETATVPYQELEFGSDLHFYDDEISGPLFVTREVEDVSDEDLEDLWTRFPDPDPNTAYKLVTVRVYWGGQAEGGTSGDMENVTLNWIRVRRENTVEFNERVSGQAP